MIHVKPEPHPHPPSQIQRMLVLLLSCMCFPAVFLWTNRSQKYGAPGESRGPVTDKAVCSGSLKVTSCTRPGFPVPSSCLSELSVAASQTKLFSKPCALCPVPYVDSPELSSSSP